METILVLYVVIGLLSAVVAVPLIKGKVQPNALYGFRVPQTLDDAAVWYAVNAHFGRRLLLTGIRYGAGGSPASRFGLDVDSYALGAAGGLRLVLWRWRGAKLALHEDAQRRRASLTLLWNELIIVLDTETQSNAGGTNSMRTYTAIVERCPDTQLYVGYVPNYRRA